MKSKAPKPENIPSVLVVIPELHHHGGTERIVHEEVRHFSKNLRVTVLTSKCGVSLPESVRLVRLPKLLGFGVLKYLSFYVMSSLWILGRQLLGKAFDIIYSPGINSAQGTVSLSVFARHFLERDLIVSRPLNIWGWLRYGNRLVFNVVVFPLEWMGYRLGRRKILCVSKTLVRWMSSCYGVNADRMLVIYPGVDVDEFSPEKVKAIRTIQREKFGFGADDKVILFIGTDLARKGFSYLVEAVRLCRNHHIKIMAVTQDYAEAYRGEKQITFVPPITSVLDYYSVADLLVHPALFDPFALPVSEAIACGIPTLISQTTGAAEILEDGVDCLVIRSPRDTNEIKSKIELLFADKTLAKRLAQNGRRKVERWTWAEHTRQLEEMLLVPFSEA